MAQHGGLALVVNGETLYSGGVRRTGGGRLAADAAGGGVF